MHCSHLVIRSLVVVAFGGVLCLAAEDESVVEPLKNNEGLRGQMRLFSPNLPAGAEFLSRGKDYSLHCPNAAADYPDFFGAWRLCLAMGKQFATVETAFDNAKLTALLKANSFTNPAWIGGTDLGRPGSYIWLANDRRVGALTGYTNWNSPPQDNGCTAAQLVGQHAHWFSGFCQGGSKLCYVCQDFLT